MKKLFLFIFFPMLVFAKEKPAIGTYFNQKNDTIYYKEIFVVDSTISEDTLHEIALEYLQSLSVSGKDVVRVDNQHTNTIIGNGLYFERNNEYEDLGGININYSIRISYKYGKIKIELYDFRIKYTYRILGVQYDFNSSLVSHYNSQQEIRKYWDSLYFSMHMSFGSVEKGCEPFFLKRIAELKQGW